MNSSKSHLFTLNFVSTTKEWKPGLSACTNGSTARSHAVQYTFYRPAMWNILESIISDTNNLEYYFCRIKNATQSLLNYQKNSFFFILSFSFTILQIQLHILRKRVLNDKPGFYNPLTKEIVGIVHCKMFARNRPEIVLSLSS